MLVSGIAVSVCARTPDAQRLFDDGRSAFERQDYAQALTAFEAALAAEMDGPAIHFNIGVAAYRAGAYDRARAAFERVALTRSMASLAHYNLGLVALAQNDERRAIHAFERVVSESEDERLRSLARARLDELGSDLPPDIVWVAYASSGIGHDDNVTLTSGGQALGIARESDMYGDTFIVGSLRLDQWRFDADASWLNYADLDEYDQWGLGVGARYQFALEMWTLDLGAQVGTAYLDGERLDMRESVYLQAARSIADAFALRMRYRITNVQGSDDYPGLDGLAHEVTARVTQRIGRSTASYVYAAELNDYDSEALSTVRHRVSAELRVPVSRAWAVRGSLAYRHSDYDHPDIETEQRIEVGASAELALTDHWTLALQYAFTDNDGSPEFSYRRNRVFARVDVIF